MEKRVQALDDNRELRRPGADVQASVCMLVLTKAARSAVERVPQPATQSTAAAKLVPDPLDEDVTEEEGAGMSATQPVPALKKRRRDGAPSAPRCSDAVNGRTVRTNRTGTSTVTKRRTRRSKVEPDWNVLHGLLTGRVSNPYPVRPHYVQARVVQQIFFERPPQRRVVGCDSRDRWRNSGGAASSSIHWINASEGVRKRYGQLLRADPTLNKMSFLQYSLVYRTPGKQEEVKEDRSAHLFSIQGCEPDDAETHEPPTLRRAFSASTLREMCATSTASTATLKGPVGTATDRHCGVAPGKRLQFRFDTVRGGPEWFSGSVTRVLASWPEIWVGVRFDGGELRDVQLKPDCEGAVWRWESPASSSKLGQATDGLAPVVTLGCLYDSSTALVNTKQEVTGAVSVPNTWQRDTIRFRGDILERTAKSMGRHYLV